MEYLGYIAVAVAAFLFGGGAPAVAESAPVVVQAPVVAADSLQAAFAVQPLNLWLMVFAVLSIVLVAVLIYLFHSSSMFWRLRESVNGKVEDEFTEMKAMQQRTQDQFIQRMMNTENLRDMTTLLVPLTKE